jgi:hypothetical protein
MISNHALISSFSTSSCTQKIPFSLWKHSSWHYKLCRYDWDSLFPWKRLQISTRCRLKARWRKTAVRRQAKEDVQREQICKVCPDRVKEVFLEGLPSKRIWTWAECGWLVIKENCRKWRVEKVHSETLQPRLPWGALDRHLSSKNNWKANWIFKAVFKKMPRQETWVHHIRITQQKCHVVHFHSLLSESPTWLAIVVAAPKVSCLTFSQASKTSS